MFTSILPSSPAFRCLDRFSIAPALEAEEDADGHVPFWPILKSLLGSPISSPSQLVDLLETLAVTLRNTSGPAGDYGLLKAFAAAHSTVFFDTCWPAVAALALELPLLFPEGALPVLQGNDAIQYLSLSRRQAACLVAHQFLCTLRAPGWRDECYDFSIWYDSRQRHETACWSYLTSLLEYFKQLSSDADALRNEDEDWKISYTLCTRESAEPPQLHCELCPIEVLLVEEYDTSPDSLGLPNGAAVVSANRFVGFGQSATQEEIHVGISPEACPAVLVTPPLADDQVLVVRGAKAMINLIGQRRDIRICDSDTRQAASSVSATRWCERVMLFMDALELDLAADDATLPDLEPDNLHRELAKAYLAFSSTSCEAVTSPLWGCGAFGGDPGVKALLLWCSASAASRSLRIICDEPLHGIGEELKSAIALIRGRYKSAHELFGLISQIPRHSRRLQTLSWLIQNTQER